MESELQAQRRTFEGSTLRQTIRRAQEVMGENAQMVETQRLEGGGWQVVAEAGQAASQDEGNTSDERGRSDLLQDLRAEVSELRRLVSVLETGAVSETESFLRRRGLSPDTSRALARIEQEGRVMERAIPVATDLHQRSGPVRVVLVGPTGGGKTTTLAKLAAELLLGGKSVYLIGTDTFRIGALDQLQQYARIMDVPLSVARDRHELERALQRAEDYDAVLVDTIGRGSRARKDVEALGEVFRGVSGLERHLVLPANADVEDARLTWQTFRYLDPHGLLATKLDETGRPARIVEVAVASGLPLFAYGSGQRVPEDFGFFSPEVIRRDLLGLSGRGAG